MSHQTFTWNKGNTEISGANYLFLQIYFSFMPVLYINPTFNTYKNSVNYSAY